MSRSALSIWDLGLVAASLIHVVGAVISDVLFDAGKVIEKDVIVVGGGASGSHAAVRLREDFGKSIVVIEKQGRLGGHTATYQDGETGEFYNYGIQSFIDYADAKAFVERFNISVGTLPRVARNTSFVDFDTGVPVNYIRPPPEETSAALAKYTELATQYEKYLAPGYWNFPAPEDIPEDLVMPFQDFVKKYALEAMVPTIFEITVMGLGDPLPVPTMYVMQAFGAPISNSGSFTPLSGNNMELYDQIEEVLGEDVMYNSMVVVSERTDTGVKVVVENPAGERTLIKAKRLLVSIEPTPNNMKPFDLDEKESAVFEQFLYTDVQCGIVTHPSLPEGFSLDNTPEFAAPSNYLALPKVPFIARFDWMGRNLFRVLMVGDGHWNAKMSLQQVSDTVGRLARTGVIPRAEADAVQVVAFADHGPMHLNVGTEQLKRGFIQEQYSLQGRRSTWYTGAGWSMQFTSVLWAFTDTVLPRMFDGI